MKTKKIIVASLLCLVPLGLFADGHDKDNDEKGCSDKYFSIKNDFIKSKGVNLIFEGKIQSQPKSGFNGIWKISGMDIVVDDQTIVIHFLIVKTMKLVY